MKIVDGNGRIKEAISLKVISHQIPDAVHGGIAVAVQYVEAEIQGRHRKGSWTEWYPLEEFRKANPTIRI